MIKCSCHEAECKISIRFDEYRLWFTDKEGKETLMYMDANSIKHLVGEFRVVLNDLVFEEG